MSRERNNGKKSEEYLLSIPLEEFVALLQNCNADQFKELFIYNPLRRRYSLSVAALRQRREASQKPRKRSGILDESKTEKILKFCKSIRAANEKLINELTRNQSGKETL